MLKYFIKFNLILRWISNLLWLKDVNYKLRFEYGFKLRKFKISGYFDRFLSNFRTREILIEIGKSDKRKRRSFLNFRWRLIYNILHK